MRAIFLSYRRDDSEGQAGRLFDDLVAHFGADSVFMDVAGIEAGRDFRKAIDQHVASCGVLLAMIGKDWVDAKDKQGKRRLDDPTDFVRFEIAAALKRDIPVIPVLVERANMPSVEQLPTDLESFAYRNAVELSHARWNSDVQVLFKALARYVDDTSEGSAALPGMSQASEPPDNMSRGKSQTQTEKAVPSSSSGRSWRTYALTSVLLMLIFIGGFIGFKYYSDNAVIQAEKEETGVQAKADEGKQATEAKNQHANNEAIARAEEERLAIAKAEKVNVGRKEEKFPHPDESSTPKLDKSDIKNDVTGSSQDRVTPQPNNGQLTPWIPFPDFKQALQRQPKGMKFPYNFEGKCMADGGIELRAKFGPLPPGVSYFSYWVEPIGKYEQKSGLRQSEGYTEFSRQTCKLPSGQVFVQSVFIKNK